MNAHVEAPSALTMTQLVTFDPDSRTVHYRDQSVEVGSGPQARSGLATWLYTHVHAGNPNAFSADAVLPDSLFENSIRASIGAHAIAVPVVPVMPVGTDPQVVDLHRIRLAVAGEELRCLPGAGLTAQIPSQRPNLTPGFFMYVNDLQTWTADTTVVRFYVGHNDPVEALAIWSTAVTRLTELGVEFRSKILSRRGAYPRNDALVFYVTVDADRLVSELYTVMADLSISVTGYGSPLCSLSSLGIYSAEDPRDMRPGPSQPSYGEHRCGVIADALLSAMSGEETYLDAMTRFCFEANIDPDNLARNGATQAAQRKIA